MTVVDTGPRSGGLVQRIKNILITPKSEWEVIDGEPATVQGLYTRYIMILAAIPPLAKLVGLQLFGTGWLGLLTVRPSLVGGIAGAVISYLLALAAVFVVAMIIDVLAPSFGGARNKTQALKVAAYSYTAVWIAGIFYILPPLGPLVMVASFYGLYLLYLGLPRLMKAPDSNAVGYAVVTLISALVVTAVATMVAASIGAAILGLGMASGAYRTAGASGGTVNIGGRSVDLGKLEQASREMAEAAKRVQSRDGAPAIPVDTMKALLPATLAGGYLRTEVTTGTVASIGASGAEAKYARGDSTIELSVGDTAAAGALATLGSAFGVASSKETATGYEKLGMVNGRMTQEEYDRQDRSGEYGVLVGNRFMIHARGQQVEMNQLKAAVDAVGLARLEAMTKG